jgi:hypothetical protein
MDMIVHVYACMCCRCDCAYRYYMYVRACLCTCAFTVDCAGYIGVCICLHMYLNILSVKNAKHSVHRHARARTHKQTYNITHRTHITSSQFTRAPPNNSPHTWLYQIRQRNNPHTYIHTHVSYQQSPHPAPCSPRELEPKPYHADL